MRLPRDVSGDDLAKALADLGYRVTRQTGSHLRLTTLEGGEHHITIPRHAALRVGTLAGILGDVAQHFALTREDPDAVEEPRSVTLGLSNLANLLVVVYAYREPDIIRIISAWKANRRQRGQYDKGRS